MSLIYKMLTFLRRPIHRRRWQQMVLLWKGKSCRVYFPSAFACLIIFSWRLVFIMQIHASPNQRALPVRLWEVSAKEMMLSVSWNDILTECGKYCLHMRVISCSCSKSTTSGKKNALKSQWSMFSFGTVCFDRYVSGYGQWFWAGKRNLMTNYITVLKMHWLKVETSSWETESSVWWRHFCGTFLAHIYIIVSDD